MELPRIILTPGQKNGFRKARAWLYGVTLAALPVAVFYGLVDPKAAPLWLAVAVALLNLSPKEPAPTPGRDFFLERQED